MYTKPQDRQSGARLGWRSALVPSNILSKCNIVDSFILYLLQSFSKILKLELIPDECGVCVF
ncbi:hypothetical protein F2Q69_00012397 [Brassica cretica]|uniref:Uncharacterized protein n=1 Tax=Brassica cretica TaxID=69181 RepID=A0A8S9R4D4_BRACR|nr:hypothetical protein F2Q69_00012397 [Brassica cretica]